MVKGEIANRPKPTKEQVRVAQITQDGQTVNDPVQLNKIRKVMELTRCSEIDADFALHDSGNDVEQAVLTLLENGSTWKENKGRKTKKQESSQRDEQNRRTDSRGPANRGKGGSYQGKGGNFPPRSVRDGQEFKPKDRQQPNQGPRGNGNVRGNKPVPNQKDNGQTDMQKFPPISSFNNDFANTEEDNTWKNGPLVFEKSASVAPSVNSAAPDSFTTAPSISTTKSEKLSFAAVAASKKPVQAVQPVVTSTASSLLHPENQPTTTHADDMSLKSEAKDAASPSNTGHFTSAASDGRASPVSLTTNPVPSTSFGPTAVSNLNVNKEFTDQLKNDIGLGSSPINNVVMSQASVSSVAVITPNATISQQSNMDTGNSVLNTQPTALLHDVEFVSGDHSSSITDFQFGFHSEAPNAQIDSLLSERGMNKSRDAPASLSYMNTCNVEYQSNDLRLSGVSANNSVGAKPNNAISQSQPTQQQPLSQTSSGPQQPSAQQQHNASLQQQQQQMYAAAAAPFPGYGFPYLYSPVAASNMRDVEQLNNYTALSAPFPYGINAMNQLDMQLSALSLPPSMQPSVPQQSQQQHRSSVADNKFPPTNGNSSNGLQGGNSYQTGLGGVGSQTGHQMRGQAASDNGTAGGAAGGVAPPPGFSGPPFLTQPSFQSLFQLPNYSHPGQMSLPYFLQANPNNGGGNNVGGMPPSGNFGQGLGNVPQSGRNAGGGLDNGSQYYNPAPQSNKWGTGNWRS
ncbi:ubiquitin-associated protein 2 [Ditylenchus destructor]|uniref:Ubiquitin-associated protein 2 n=1 Tax=Ditylenchus destructor TaxID=166010 RepID=A0AAD4NBG3_9BILA|nr:ubiquitin-associated protein 2 [Ditylenchus destructor]